jgi:hypothetical protein
VTNATPGPRSFGTPEDGITLPHKTPGTQAAKRAAYIASILADWPALTPQQQNTIGSLLGAAA